MPQDYFTLNRFIPQLKKSIIGAKVNKINEPTSDDLFISIYNGKPLKLHISTNAKLCHIGISNIEFEKFSFAIAIFSRHIFKKLFSSARDFIVLKKLNTSFIKESSELS